MMVLYDVMSIMTVDVFLGWDFFSPLKVSGGIPVFRSTRGQLFGTTNFPQPWLPHIQETVCLANNLIGYLSHISQHNL